MEMQVEAKHKRKLKFMNQMVMDLYLVRNSLCYIAHSNIPLCFSVLFSLRDIYLLIVEREQLRRCEQKQKAKIEFKYLNRRVWIFI